MQIDIFFQPAFGPRYKGLDFGNRPAADFPDLFIGKLQVNFQNQSDALLFGQAPALAVDPEQLEKDEKISQNLRSLPEEQRIALILKIYLEFSYKQIREISGWSIPKIETLISRAKSRLKKNIALQEKNSGFILKARKK